MTVVVLQTSRLLAPMASCTMFISQPSSSDLVMDATMQGTVSHHKLHDMRTPGCTQGGATRGTLLADLVRCMEPVPRGTTINFVRASSYGSGTQSSGQVGWSWTEGEGMMGATWQD
jgi:hypothetical protein